MAYDNRSTIKSTIITSSLALLVALTGCVPAATAPEQAAPAAAAPPATASAATLEILASYPEGSFLENLEVQTDGNVLFTNYFTKTIERVTPQGAKSVFSNLSAFPVSIISTANGYLVAAQGKNFLAGDPSFVKSNQFLMLDKSGKEIGKFAAPDALFLNGMVKQKNGDILVADSVAGVIWKVDMAGQKITPWLRHEILAPVPGQQPGIPGANGMKLHPKGLLFSNTTRASLFVVKLDSKGNPAGEPELFAETGLIDDFWVNDDNSVIYTTHTEELKSIAPDGTISTVISKGCNGCTAVAPFPLGQSKSFVIINDGGFFFGKPQESTVAVVTVN